MVRGHFATSLYASLSRLQLDFGGPSSFGLTIARFPWAYDPAAAPMLQREISYQKSMETMGAMNGSSFELGAMIDRGCFNYRWPVTEYYIELHPYQQAIETAKRGEIEALYAARGMNVMIGSQDSPEREANTDKNEGSGIEDKDHHERDRISESRHVGTCQMLSCAIDGIFYQVLRIEELREDEEFDMSFPEDSQIVLTIGGPVCKY
jgi:hypothetical protein